MCHRVMAGWGIDMKILFFETKYVDMEKISAFDQEEDVIHFYQNGSYVVSVVFDDKKCAKRALKNIFESMKDNSSFLALESNGFSSSRKLGG